MHDKLVRQLINHEGERLKPYRCTAGRLTIGVGRNLDDKGITKGESHFMLVNDIAECSNDLHDIFADWDSFSENRKIALIDMRFMGYKSFRTFRRMIAAIKGGDWALAGKEAMDSKWAREDVSKIRSGLIYTQLVGG